MIVRALALSLAPFLLWALEVHARPWLIRANCLADAAAAACDPSRLLALDRWAMGFNSSWADTVSLYTQNLSGALAVLIPLTLLLARQGKPGAAARECVIFFRTWGWNGALTEFFRLASSRPRPYVYAEPAFFSGNPGDYTSFYSGHTSFCAAAMTFLVFSLRRLDASRLAIGLGISCGLPLVFMTGTLRVLAGRHFPTDVLAGAFMGALVAVLVSRVHSRFQL